jgi:hypothetical protein
MESKWNGPKLRQLLKHCKVVAHGTLGPSNFIGTFIHDCIETGGENSPEIAIRELSQVYSLFHSRVVQNCEWILHFNSKATSKIVACTGWDREQSEIMSHTSLYDCMHHSIAATRCDNPASGGSRVVNGYERIFI